jgi:hypothetical protein
MPLSSLLSSLAFAVLAGSGLEVSIPGTDAAVLDRLVSIGKNQNRVMDYIRELTGTIGPRLTGSPKAMKACEWAAAKFKEFGLSNVRLEEYGEMPVAFDRGKRQIARVIAPYQANLEFTTDAWTPGTDGPQRGPAVPPPASIEELEKNQARYRGAWVVYERPVPGRGGAGGDLEKRLSEAGILGRVIPVNGERISTGGRFTGLTWETLPKDVRIKIKKSDGDRIRAELAKGSKVELLFDIENIFIKGPAKMMNVVADIPGAEHPDEMVIVGAHLDSWDGPGSVGANDNATGSCAALEAARLLMRAGVRPKRTIRFCLWTGEEQGLLGSKGYVERHKSELDKISAVFVDDGGTNFHGGHQCTASQAPLLQPVIDFMTLVFPEMPQKLQRLAAVPRGGSSDHASFLAQGVPAFYTIESGRADYGHIWHTQNDRVEFTVAEYMVQSSLDHAVMAYSLANAPLLMPRG